MADRRLLLLGAGHAHLFVLKRLVEAPLAGVAVTLVAPFPHHHYSGMVPGYLQGTYEEAELAFDLPRLCRAAHARFVEAFAERVDKLTAICAVCGEDAVFHVRVDAPSARPSDLVADHIGGTEKYQARCRRHLAGPSGPISNV